MKRILSLIWAVITMVILPMVSIFVFAWILQLREIRLRSFDLEWANALFTPAFICCVIFGITLAYIMGYRTDSPTKLRGTTPFSITILFTVVSVLSVVLLFPMGIEFYAHLFEVIVSRVYPIFYTSYFPQALVYVYLGLILYKTSECWFFYLKERKKL